ncbi:MAG: vanadium-dependent haloperoxidase [Bacteroidales bacterium]
MKTKTILISSLTIAIAAFAGCQQKKVTLPSDSEILHNNQDKLTQVIIYDVFTPPVASRIYAYTSLASYEAVRFSNDGAASVAERLNGFGRMPVPDKGKNYNFTLSATKAFFEVARKVRIFSADSLKSYEETLYNDYKSLLDKETYDRSLAFGDSVSIAILRRANADGYIQSRGKPKYLGSNAEGKWRPTPPDYLDGVEWCWNTMKPFALDSASQFKPSPPPVFSHNPNSIYQKGLMEVYNINKNLTQEQKDIARYWDDNPMVIEHSGHMMFGNKKITPGGHWMGICATACRKSGADAVTTAKAYALTAMALHDAFISCWDEKYRSSFIRPVTAINESVDKLWLPFLQTPPFPEYTSGHSSISASASTVLTALFGENFAFRDTSDLRYIGMERNFNSFAEAASEASISRVYGGIHYRFTADTSSVQGRKVGLNVIGKVLSK